MSKGKRSPTAHRTVEQMREHGRNYGGTEEQKKNRAARNRARAEAIKDGRARKGDGKDIDHKVPLSKGGSTAESNTRVASRHKNRGHGMSPGGTHKRKY